MSTIPPALAAARNSWSCIHRKAKQEWLDLMADDICIEDPIGASPLDPAGKGHAGKSAVSAFWDRNIAPATIRIEAHRSFAAGNESAHWMTLTTSLPGGTRMTVTGIFTYEVDEAGKLKSLRGYWSLADAVVEKAS
jgi:steroid delta-isomerase